MTSPFPAEHFRCNFLLRIFLFFLLGLRVFCGCGWGCLQGRRSKGPKTVCIKEWFAVEAKENGQRRSVLEVPLLLFSSIVHAQWSAQCWRQSNG